MVYPQTAAMHGGQASGNYVVCMVPVGYMPQGQQFAATTPRQQLDNYRSGGGETGHYKQSMMWGGQQQSYQMWDSRVGQQEKQQRGNGSQRSWDVTAAPFVPSSFKAEETPIAFQFSAAAKPFDAASLEKPRPPLQIKQSLKKLLSTCVDKEPLSARVDAVTSMPDDRENSEDITYDLQPHATGQPDLGIDSAKHQKANMIFNALNIETSYTSAQNSESLIACQEKTIEDNTPPEIHAAQGEVEQARDSAQGWHAQPHWQKGTGKRFQQTNQLQNRRQPLQDLKKQEKKQEEVAPLSAADFPSLAKGKPKETEEVDNRRIAGTAWGKAGMEARKSAAQQGPAKALAEKEELSRKEGEAKDLTVTTETAKTFKVEEDIVQAEKDTTTDDFAEGETESSQDESARGNVADELASEAETNGRNGVEPAIAEAHSENCKRHETEEVDEDALAEVETIATSCDDKADDEQAMQTDRDGVVEDERYDQASSEDGDDIVESESCEKLAEDDKDDIEASEEEDDDPWGDNFDDDKPAKSVVAEVEETPKPTQSEEEENMVDELEDPSSEHDEVDSCHILANSHSSWLASLLSYRSFGKDTPEDFVFSALEKTNIKEEQSEPSDRSLFGSARVEDRQGGNQGRRDRRDPDRRGRGEREGREIEKLTLDSLGSKAEHAYKRRDANDESISREVELQRCAKSLLNKICPENIETIAKRIKNEAKVATINELEIVIELIFKKALAEPHYCETYAGMVFMLKGEMPSFPNPKGGKDVTFKSILLNVCQSEFEKMPRSIKTSVGDEVDEEEMKYRIEKMKGLFLANMKFIGHLFLQKLLSTAIIASIISDLIGSNPGSGDTIPEEHVVECVCELLSAIGYTLEEMAVGKDCVTQVCGRLIDLKSMKKKDGKGLLSKRLQFHIQDLLDMRAAGWVKKTFKAVAKTKDEVRAQQEQEENDMKRGKSVSGADVIVAGARPGHSQSANQADGWQEINSKKVGRR